MSVQKKAAAGTESKTVILHEKGSGNVGGVACDLMMASVASALRLERCNGLH